MTEVMSKEPMEVWVRGYEAVWDAQLRSASVSRSGRVRRSPDRLVLEKEREEEQPKELQVEEVEM